MASVDLREELKRDLRRHARVVHQELFGDSAARGKLAEALPTFQPFKGDRYAATIWCGSITYFFAAPRSKSW